MADPHIPNFPDALASGEDVAFFGNYNPTAWVVIRSGDPFRVSIGALEKNPIWGLPGSGGPFPP